MNEQLQGKLVEILTSIQDAARTTGDFAMTELPDIAQSYVLYGLITTSVRLVIGLLILIGGVWLACQSIKRDGFRDGPPLQFSLSLLPIFVGSLIAIGNFTSLCLVWFAPKVWLLKEIAGLLK